MDIKKEVKNERITIRVSSNTKRGIKILSNKKGKTISLYLSDYIEQEIERLNIPKYEVSENQIEIDL